MPKTIIKQEEDDGDIVVAVFGNGYLLKQKGDDGDDLIVVAKPVELARTILPEGYSVTEQVELQAEQRVAKYGGWPSGTRFLLIINGNVKWAGTKLSSYGYVMDASAIAKHQASMITAVLPDGTTRIVKSPSFEQTEPERPRTEALKEVLDLLPPGYALIKVDPNAETIR
jgi:hypothetical protein